MPTLRTLSLPLILAGTLVVTVACSGDEVAQPAADGAARPAESAAGGESGQPPSVELADDWTLTEGDGYQIGLPPGWFDAHRALDDEDFMAEMSSSFGDFTDDDEFRAMLEEDVADGLDLLAFRISDLNSEFASNINVIVQQRGPMDEPEVLRELAPDMLASVGGMVTGMDEYDVRGMPNLEVTYDLDLPSGEVMGIQNYLFTDDVIYVATYTAVEPDRALWASVLETFTPLP